MPFNIGGGEMVFLLVIVLIVFGAGRLPEVFGQVGKGVRSFREESTAASATPTTPSPAQVTRSCAKCANPLPAAAKFCPNCGTPI
jgi:sec-independent protein translocase protein TatA